MARGESPLSRRHHGKPAHHLHGSEHGRREDGRLPVDAALVEEGQQMREQHAVLQRDHGERDREQPVGAAAQDAQRLAGAPAGGLVLGVAGPARPDPRRAR